ncbi:hypothetical protein [Kribbella sp. NPDC051718]|uniref:hypothetical protein n=1 Tax=Kribbella sp. NPDC051718 TaxID=3155168 RepID=UPI0034344D33
MFEGIKLVVWDLDETLWKGTLDEGDGIEPTDLMGWIGPLASAGIVSSVCSNNDLGRARESLVRYEIWDLVVLPAISWSPKSMMMRELLDQINLRPEQVLFVDDNARIRSEVRGACGVVTAAPDDLRPVSPATLEFVDAERTRLAAYKILERRAAARTRQPATSNADFLRQSRIVVSMLPVTDFEERVAELSLRSNQLNLTSSRLSVAEVRQLSARPDLTCGCLFLRDQYGDYGLIGYYAVMEPERRLLHAFFSCRIMNMGVERWLLQRLGVQAPELARGTGADPMRDEVVDWISVGTAVPAVRPPSASVDHFFVGGCDLQAIAPLVSSSIQERSDWQLIESSGPVQQYGHSSLLVLDLVWRSRAGILDSLPWLTNWTCDIYRPSLRVVVLSLWVDYACLTMRHRETGERVPSYVHLTRSSSEEDWEHWWGSRSGRKRFLDEFEPDQPLTPDEIADGIAQLAGRLGETRLLLLNAPEFVSSMTYANGDNQARRNRAVNRAVAEVSDSHETVDVVDLRGAVESLADLASPDQGLIFHYHRQAYLRIAGALEAKLTAENGPSSPHPGMVARES